MVGLLLAGLAAAVAAPRRDSVNAAVGQCSQIAALAMGKPDASGRPVLSDVDALTAYCRSVWPEQTDNCPALAEALLGEARETQSVEEWQEVVRRFCKVPGHPKPAQPSFLHSLAAVFYPARSKHGEVWDTRSVGKNGVTVTMPAVNKLLARRDAVLAGKAAPAEAAPAEAAPAASAAAAPPAAQSQVTPAGPAPKSAPVSAHPPSAQTAHLPLAATATAQATSKLRTPKPKPTPSLSQRYAARQSITRATVVEGEAPLWRRVLGFFCDYKCIYTPRKSMQITSEASNWDDD
jgi:hypothetical protein